MLQKNILDESNRKSNKIWVGKGSEFYSTSIKSLLEKNAIEMYSAHNEGKSVVAKRFLRTLKTKFLIIWLQYLKNCILKIR